MTPAPRSAAHSGAVPADTVVIKYLRSDRGPQGCFATGDVAGWPHAVANKLIAQGYAELYDAGKGLGKVNSMLITPGREAWESEEDFKTHYLRVTGELPPAAKKN